MEHTICQVLDTETGGAGILRKEFHSPFMKAAGKPGAHEGATEKPGEMGASLLTGVHFNVLWKHD